MLVSKIHAGIEGTYQLPSVYSTQLDIQQFNKQSLTPVSLDSGTGPKQCDTIFSSERVLAASASENLDLNGTMNDPLGQVVNFLHVKGIEIEADAGNTNNVIIGGTAANAFVGPFGGAANTWSLAPGDRIVAYSAAGWPVTPATADLLKVANSAAGTSVKYRITIIGTST
jgi:hypothetical protein